MRSWRCGNLCVSVTRDGVALENNVGGSTLTSEGGGCSLEDFLDGRLHDAIPADVLPEAIEEAARLAGRNVREVLDALERRRRKAVTGFETVEEATRADSEWAALIRDTAGSTPPERCDEELARSVAGLAQKPEHAGWARPFLERALRATGNPWILAACIEGLSAPTSPPSERWVQLGVSEAPRLAGDGETATLPTWIRGLPSCPSCGSERTSLLFCRDGSRSDQSYDYRDAAAEVRCASCGAFSLHACHAESRS
jgi:hypothetical protein